MLNKHARAFFTRVLTPFASMLLRAGVSPDVVTLVGTAGAVVGALAFFPRGEFFWGTVVVTLFIFSDLVDGTMARQSGISTRWGAFLDSTLDRVADAAVFGGIAMWYAGRGGDPVLCAVAVFCLACGQVVSYTKARAESLGLRCDVSGLVERAERLVVSLVAAGLSGLHAFGVPYVEWLLPAALWLIAAGSLVTVLQRMLTVRREAAEAEAAVGDGQGEDRARQERTRDGNGRGTPAGDARERERHERGPRHPGGATT